MDIAALSTAMSMQQLHLNVSYAMMAKAMDTMEMSTEAMAEMMDAAAQISGGAAVPGLGENIDILV
ncbi:MAG: putative motility protein [Dorea sp.]|nr:putative motility protein [Dorea sp.]